MSALSTASANRADDADDYDIADGYETMEVEEEEEEIGNLSDSPHDIAEDRIDVSEEQESVEHTSHLDSDSSTLEKSKARMPSDALAIAETRCSFGSSNEAFTSQKEVTHEIHEESKYVKSGKRLIPAEDNGSQECESSKKDVEASTSVKTTIEKNDLHTDCKLHLHNSCTMEPETASPSSFCGKTSHRGEGTFEDEIKLMGMHSGHNKQRLESRFASPAVMTRRASPGAEIKNGIKRPAVICDFFSKGWCIKGNSCRFLHVKDDVNKTTQLVDEDVAVASVSTVALADEGSRNKTKMSRMPFFPDPPCTVRNNEIFYTDLSSERLLTQEPQESKRSHQFQENCSLSLLLKDNRSSDNYPSSQKLASSRDDIGFLLASKDAGRESLRQNWPAETGNCASLMNIGSSPTFGKNLHRDYRYSSTGSVLLPSNGSNGNPSSYPSSLQERPQTESKYIHNDSPSPVVSHTIRPGIVTSGPTSSSFPSHHISAWKGSLLPFHSGSLNASPLDAKKLSDSNREFRNSRLALFLRATPPVSGSDLEKHEISSDNKMKISSNEWEPSVPFRPSFIIATTETSAPGGQYDPLRDSFDSPMIGHVSLGLAFSSVGDSALNLSDQKLCGDSVVSNTIVPGCIGDKSSVSSHCKFNENVADENCHTADKDLLADREGVGTSDEQNGSVRKDYDPSLSTNIRDISISKNFFVNCDSKTQNDVCRYDKEAKVDRAGQSSETDLERKADGDVCKESKLTKHFRTGLVAFVKELLKPTWREGRLSKDAHNTIVKKAVDKVLSTFQPHQIPTTMESIKQYLSTSQPKIAKLVEGYVDKYGKG